MDLADLKRRSLAARETSHEIDGRAFTLRVPTRHETTVAVRRASAGAGGDEAAVYVIVRRNLLEAAIVRWSGVKVGDMLPGEGDAGDDYPHEPGAVPFLLDAQTDWAAELSDKLVELIAARNSLQDSAAKN